ncbi:hypothetical protein NMC30_08455 [Agrobacterium tumefaciens]|nr:hypothetical protein [Agrobacterium tumefaciens]MCW8057247.1 hypothetical protein [Agrobacterium tumefaciens]
MRQSKDGAEPDFCGRMGESYTSTAPALASKESTSDQQGYCLCSKELGRTGLPGQFLRLGDLLSLERTCVKNADGNFGLS